MKERKKHALDHAPPFNRTEQNTPPLVEVCVQKMGRACVRLVINEDFYLREIKKKLKREKR